MYCCPSGFEDFGWWIGIESGRLRVPCLKVRDFTGLEIQISSLLGLQSLHALLGVSVQPNPKP